MTRDPELLGKRSDNEIAKLWGCSRERVRQIRNELGIPKFKLPEKNCRTTDFYSCISSAHGWVSYVKGCKCKICSLSNCIATFLLKNKLKQHADFCTYTANRYLEFYELDDSTYKRSFYSFIQIVYKEIYIESNHAIYMTHKFCDGIGKESI